MPAAKKAFVIEQRATWARRLKWTDSKGKAINLTGCIVRMHIRKTAESLDLIFDLSTVNGRITVNALAGVIDLQIDADDTDAMTFGSGVYDVKVEFPGGQEVRLLEGSIKVSPGVTV